MTEQRIEPEQNERPVLIEHLSTGLMKSAAGSIAKSAMTIGDIPRRFGARIALEPAVSPQLHVELRRFKVALNQVQPDTTYQYHLLTTRRLATPEQGTAWRRYVLGIKLLDTDPFVAEYRQQIEDLLGLSDEEKAQKKQGLTGYDLQEVLEEMDVSVEKAGELFLEQARVSLKQFSLASAPAKEMTWTREEIWFAKPTQPGYQAEPVYNYKLIKGLDLRLPSLEMEPELIKKAAKGLGPKQFSLEIEPKLSTAGTAEMSQKGVLADIQQVIRFLERLLEQARQYAVDLVAMLEHYLTIARRLVSEVQAERRLAADEQAIEQTLTKLDPQEIINRLAAIPVYMHHGQDEEGTALSTAIIPQFQNQTLNNGYQWFWVQLMQTAREQALIPSDTTQASSG